MSNTYNITQKTNRHKYIVSFNPISKSVIIFQLKTPGNRQFEIFSSKAEEVICTKNDKLYSNMYRDSILIKINPTKYIYIRNNVLTFDTLDEIVSYRIGVRSEDDSKIPYVTDKSNNVYFLEYHVMMVNSKYPLIELGLRESLYGRQYKEHEGLIRSIEYINHPLNPFNEEDESQLLYEPDPEYAYDRMMSSFLYEAGINNETKMLINMTNKVQIELSKSDYIELMEKHSKQVGIYPLNICELGG